MISLYWVPSAVCAGFAGYMAYHDKAGWGWFLFGAILLAPVLRSNAG